VLGYSSKNSDGSQMAIATIFSADGVEGHSTNITHRADATIASDLAMTALGQERLVVTWTERFLPDVGDQTEENVKAMVLIDDSANKILIPLNQGTRVNSVAAGVQRLQCVAAMDTGVIAFAWIDDSVEGHEGRNRIRAHRSL
jgi:hypothetical protein